MSRTVGVTTEDPDYHSIKITKRAYDALIALRDELYEHGMGPIPVDLRPIGISKVVSISNVVEVCVLVTQRSLRKEKNK